MEIFFYSITFTSVIQHNLSEDAPPKSCLHTITAFIYAASGTNGPDRDGGVNNM